MPQLPRGKYKIASLEMVPRFVRAKFSRSTWKSWSNQNQHFGYIHYLIFIIVSYFLRWTLLEYSSQFPINHGQQVVRRLGKAVINTWNEVKCPLQREFWIYNFSRRILERAFVGNVVFIMNECLFSGFIWGWIGAQNKTSSENSFLVHAICLSRALINSQWAQKKC